MQFKFEHWQRYPKWNALSNVLRIKHWAFNKSIENSLDFGSFRRIH